MEFKRQTSVLGRLWARQGSNLEVISFPMRNHFTILEELAPAGVVPDPALPGDARSLIIRAPSAGKTFKGGSPWPPSPQGHHHLRRHRLDPYADHDALSADHAGRDRRRQSIAAAEAGASIIHLHARDPKDGRPTPDPEVFMQFLPRIKQSCDAVVNITTGGGAGMTHGGAPGRAAARQAGDVLPQHGLDEFRPLSRCSTATRSWKYDWEPKHLEGRRDFIFRNTFKDIERVMKELGEGCGTRFEFECYDVGHLYTLAHFLDRGLVKPPLFVQTIFGILGGIGADPENLVHMRRIADKLFGDEYHWSILAAGRHQMPLRHHGRRSWAAMCGSGWRTVIYVGKGQLAKSNAEQVAHHPRHPGGAVAGDRHARPRRAQMLKLKGGDQVAF